MSKFSSMIFRIEPLLSGVSRSAGIGSLSVAMATIFLLAVQTPVSAETPPKIIHSPQALSVRTKAEVDNAAALIAALRNYAMRSGGQYPARLEDLVQKGILSADEFKRCSISPLDSSGLQPDGYFYYPEGKNIESGPGEVLIMGRNPLASADPRRAVGMQDGSVTWWKRPQVEAFLKAAKKIK